MSADGVTEKKVPWIERVRAADAEAEQTFANMKGFEALASHEDSPVVAAYALIAIAAELRAQRIARRQRVWAALTERGTTEASEGSEPGTPGHGSAERLSRPSTPRSVSADTEALLATVREALDFKPHWHTQDEKQKAGRAALDSLAAELEQLRGEREFIAERSRVQLDRANRAEAELERVKGLLYVEQHGKHAEKWNELWDELERVRAERDMAEKIVANEEARLDKALAALQEANQDVLLIDSPEGDSPRNIAANIRRAIAEIEGEATPPTNPQGKD